MFIGPPFIGAPRQTGPQPRDCLLRAPRYHRPAGSIELGERDPVVGQRLRLRGQRELGVGQLADRPHADVEPALGEPEVFLRRGDDHARGLDALLRGLDGDLRMLEILVWIEGWASRASAMHSSSVRTRPATGSTRVAGAAWASAKAGRPATRRKARIATRRIVIRAVEGV